MRSPRNTLALFVIVSAIIVIACSCGGVSQGLTTPGALAPQAGTTIAPQDRITIIFHRALDRATVPGNFFVTQEGADVPYHCEMPNVGYILVVVPLPAWAHGELEITLIGGEQGIHYADGRGFDSITLTYFVGN